MASIVMFNDRRVCLPGDLEVWPHVQWCRCHDNAEIYWKSVAAQKCDGWLCYLCLVYTYTDTVLRSSRCLPLICLLNSCQGLWYASHYMFLRKSIASPGFPRFQVWVFLLGSLCFIPYNHDVDNKICWSRWACHRLSVLHPTIYQYLQVGIVYTTYTNNFKIISPISDKIVQLGFGPAWSLFIEYSTFLDPDGLFFAHIPPLM